MLFWPTLVHVLPVAVFISVDVVNASAVGEGEDGKRLSGNLDVTGLLTTRIQSG